MVKNNIPSNNEEFPFFNRDDGDIEDKRETPINLNIEDGKVVVDSRLIARELGIKHKNFLATIDKYREEIEEDWGQFAFKTETVTNSVGASNTAKYALLTEPQATLLMTYSKNTEKVRICKRKLVKAFESAKQVLDQNKGKEVEELKEKINHIEDKVAN